MTELEPAAKDNRRPSAPFHSSISQIEPIDASSAVRLTPQLPVELGRHLLQADVLRLQGIVGNQAVVQRITPQIGGGPMSGPPPGIFSGPFTRPPVPVFEPPPSMVPLSTPASAGEAVEVGTTLARAAQGGAVAAGAVEGATALGMVAAGVAVVAGVLVIVAIAAGVMYLLYTDFPVQPEKSLPGGVVDPTDTAPALELPPDQARHPMSEPGTPDPIAAPATDAGVTIYEPDRGVAPMQLPPQTTPQPAGGLNVGPVGKPYQARIGPSGEPRRGEVEVPLSINSPARFERLNELIRRGGKWEELSSEDRSGLGRSFGNLLSQLAARMAKGKVLDPWVNVDQALIRTLRAQGGTFSIIEGNLGVAGRCDFLELNFDRSTAELIDVTSTDRAEHVAKTRGYAEAIEKLTGISPNALEMRYVGDDGDPLLKELLEIAVEQESPP